MSIHYTTMNKKINKTSEKDKMYQVLGCGATRTLMYCWWELLFEISSIFKRYICLSYDQGISPYKYAVKSLQLYPTLCDPIDGSPQGSAVPGILQARTLEWVAISFSNAWKWKGKVKSLSPVRLLAPHGLQPTRLLHPWIFQARVLEWVAIAFSTL